ncbi:MAG: prepilin-type N-terminal cleavage/methylation domain-containing protein [Phycisphaerales bacterium]
MTTRSDKSSLTRMHGYTLLELLVSLALLVGIVLVAVSWVSVTVRRQQDSSSSVNWYRSANMLFAQIEMDLFQRDVLANARQDPPSRVCVIDGDGALHIRTLEQRENIQVQYVFDAGDGYVRRVLSRQVPHEAAMLGEVASFKADVHVIDTASSYRRLTLEIISSSGEKLTRAYAFQDDGGAHE